MLYRDPTGIMEKKMGTTKCILYGTVDGRNLAPPEVPKDLGVTLV